MLTLQEKETFEKIDNFCLYMQEPSKRKKAPSFVYENGFKVLNDKAISVLNLEVDLICNVLAHDIEHKDDYKKRLEKVREVCKYADKREKNPDALTLYWKSYLVGSFYYFEDFMIYMEHRRPIEKQFYLPRRKCLQQVAEDLEKLEYNRKQKFYGLSLPSRVGKSTICLLFLTWIALRHPNSHSAMGGHSGLLAKGFYKELLNFMDTEEYAFDEIYRFHHPEYNGKPVITDKSAEDLTITLGDRDRFATISCRGIDGTWTGAIDISKDGYLYVDDLVRDREHSLNPVRMENTWQEYLNKMVDRKNDGAKELMVGTLWNIYDPLMRLSDIYSGNPQYVFKRIPALDFDTDESNFNYAINGFSTQYYRDMRERLGEAEWMAKFQQMPQIREGILFPRSDMHRFSKIPVAEETIVYCDPALGGGDFLSMPVIVPSEGRYKVVDWVYNAGSPKITVPKIVDKVIKWHIRKLKIEYNGGAGALVHKELKEELIKRDALYCDVEPQYSSTRLSKEDKIKGRADFVKDNFEFLEDKMQDEEYKKAFSDMCTYTTIGKNLHDDSADSIASVALEIRPFSENGTVYVPDINPFRTYGGYLR